MLWTVRYNNRGYLIERLIRNETDGLGEYQRCVHTCMPFKIYPRVSALAYRCFDYYSMCTYVHLTGESAFKEISVAIQRSNTNMMVYGRAAALDLGPAGFLAEEYVLCG